MDASTCECERAVTTEQILRLDSRDAVREAASARTLARVFLPRLQLVALDLSVEDARETQRRIDRLVDACGCGEGAGMTIVGGVAYVAYALGPGAWPGTMGAAWRVLVAMFTGATVGKLFGLVRSRLELRRVLLQLASSLPAGPARGAGDRAPPTVNDTARQSADEVFASVFTR